MKKKIAYLIQHDITLNDGVTKKIKAQTDEWRLSGVDVRIFAIVPKNGASILDANVFPSKGYIKQRLLSNTPLIQLIRQYNTDLIYTRYDTWSKTYSILAKQYKVVCELNTLDLEEFKLLAVKERSFKAWVRYLAYKMLRGYVLRKSSGLVSVTYEILNHHSNATYEKRGVVIPNSIALDEYPTIKLRSKTNGRVGLFFIGTPGQPWHGIDIIETIASNLPQYDFHLVGMEGADRSNLFYHGYLSREEYTEILKKCQICIGSLAVHRKGMKEACPLKVREYLSYGFPVILGYNDTSFIGKPLPSWVYMVTTPIDYPSLIEFIESNRNIVVKSSQLAVISVHENERNRLEFLMKV